MAKKSRVLEALSHLGKGEEFVVVELTKDGTRPVYGPDGQLLRFTTGKEASDAAKGMSSPGRKFQPRRVKDDQWREREVARFKAKEYQELPWAQHTWWKNHSHIHGMHYPHVSQKNSVGLMAFTEDDDKGSADIQTAVKPGRYLERFFGSILDPYIIRDLCTQFANKFEDNVLMFAETEDEWEKVYTEGPASCMSHPLSKFTSTIHPVRVYAGPDLKLAFMKRDGRVVARVIVWPEKKTYTRIYGDAARIEPLLKAQGYKKEPPYGARLLRVIHYQDPKKKSGEMRLVVPHIDEATHVVDHGDFLSIPRPGDTQNKRFVKLIGQSGISDLISLTCPKCATTCSPGEAVEVQVDLRGTIQRWCPTCLEAHAFRCERMGAGHKRRYANETAVSMDNGQRWSPQAFAEYGFKCPITGKNSDQSRAIATRELGYVSQEGVKLREMAQCTMGCGYYVPKGLCSCGMRVKREAEEAKNKLDAEVKSAYYTLKSRQGGMSSWIDEN